MVKPLFASSGMLYVALRRSDLSTDLQRNTLHCFLQHATRYHIRYFRETPLQYTKRLDDLWISLSTAEYLAYESVARAWLNLRVPNVPLVLPFGGSRVTYTQSQQQSRFHKDAIDSREHEKPNDAPSFRRVPLQIELSLPPLSDTPKPLDDESGDLPGSLPLRSPRPDRSGKECSLSAILPSSEPISVDSESIAAEESDNEIGDCLNLQGIKNFVDQHYSEFQAASKDSASTCAIDEQLSNMWKILSREERKSYASDKHSIVQKTGDTKPCS